MSGQTGPVPAHILASASQETTPASREPHVTLDVENMPIQDVLYKIVKQADLALSWSDAKVPLKGNVTLQLKDVPVSRALALALKDQQAEARMSLKGRTVLIVRKVGDAPGAMQAMGSIAGRVTDSAGGEGLAGVAVTVHGTKLSVLTGKQGTYALSNVPLGEQLVVFKVLGYTSVSRPVQVEEQKRIVVNVRLKPSATMLSGVVTTATGEQRKIEVGHTIAMINVDSIMKVAPILSVTDLLESRVPGLTIQRTSGTPGDPARIRIRGAGSIYQNNDPIIVVDGVRMYSEQSDARNINVSGKGADERVYATPSPLDQIDPSIIETIEILKGPSASAMYGSDAANGVIIVKTKRGRAGPPLWSAGLSSGLSTQPGAWPTSTYRFVTPLQGGPPGLCVGFCGDAHIDSVVHFQALNDPYLTVLGRGTTFGATANVSGGSQALTYNFSAKTGRERGILKLPKIEEDRYRKFQDEPVPGWMRRPDLLEERGGQGQVSVEFSPKVGLTATTLFNQSIQHRSSMSSATNSAISELQRRWIDLSQLDERPLLGNPYERVTTTTLNLNHALQLRASPTTWLPITGTFGVNTITQNVVMSIARGLLTTDESGGVWQGKTRTSSELTGTAFSLIPVMNRVNMSAGVNFTRGRTDDQEGAFYGIPEGVSDPSAGEDSTRSRFSRSTRERVSFGWFVEPRMILSQRFFFTPGFRLDNNGLSGKNAKWNSLPKMNFSWLVSDESFFPWKQAFQNVRVRTALGVSGVQPAVGDLNRLYAGRTINPFGSQEPLYGEMLQLSNLGNTRLRPERVTEVEGGLDLELMRNRLSLELTHYRTGRKDAIVSNSYAGSVDGGGSLLTNIGDIEKSGTEINLQAQIIERRNLGFHIGVGFDRKRSNVRRLNSEHRASGEPLATRPKINGVSYVVGYPVEGTWMKPILGFQDLDGNGWISFSELVLGPNEVYVGSTEPLYQMAVHPAISLFGGRLSMAATISYINGQLQTISVGNVIPSIFYGAEPHVSNIVMGPDGFDRQAAFMAAVYSLRSVGAYSLIGYTHNVNVTRLQSLSANVNLGPNVVRMLRARNASLALQGQNLGVWTNYIGVDPNVNATSTTNRSFRDEGQQPEPRRWQLRISLGY